MLLVDNLNEDQGWKETSGERRPRQWGRIGTRYQIQGSEAGHIHSKKTHMRGCVDSYDTINEKDESQPYVKDNERQTLRALQVLKTATEGAQRPQ